MAELQRETIRIRMYRVGFGDCFLLSFPTNSGHAHILVDCGVHFKADIGTIEAAVADAVVRRRINSPSSLPHTHIRTIFPASRDTNAPNFGVAV